jgi:hypothetical protein
MIFCCDFRSLEVVAVVLVAMGCLRLYAREQLVKKTKKTVDTCGTIVSIPQALRTLCRW